MQEIADILKIPKSIKLLVEMKNVSFGLRVKMEAWVNTPCLIQLQQKLQLDYKTSITQNSQKTVLYGNPTTKGLKKPDSSR